MSDMIERAAVAIFDVRERNFPMNSNEEQARAALLAALDPEDTEMMAWISCELSLDDEGEDLAYQVVATLRAMAQGESTST